MSAANLVTTTAAKRYQAVPVAFADKRTLLVAMADPSNVLAVDDIAIMTGYEVRVAVAPPDDIAGLIPRLDRLDDVVAELRDTRSSRCRRAPRSSTCTRPPRTRRSSSSSTRSSPRRSSAARRTSTSLPTGSELRVRFRVDGVLHDITTVPRRMAAGVISRVKIMAELDIAERRLPQDGRVGLTVDGGTSTCASSRCRASTARRS